MHIFSINDDTAVRFTSPLVELTLPAVNIAIQDWDGEHGLYFEVPGVNRWILVAQDKDIYEVVTLTLGGTYYYRQFRSLIGVGTYLKDTTDRRESLFGPTKPIEDVNYAFSRFRKASDRFHAKHGW